MGEWKGKLVSGSSVTTQTKANAIVELRSQVRAQALRDTLKTVGKSLLNGLTTIVIVVLLWQSIIWFTPVTDFVAKGPLDVWEHLVTGENAVETRAFLFPLMGTTLINSGIGFISGMLAAIVLGVAFRLSSAIEASLMPFALLLRSVPLVAIAPVIIMIFGLGSVASVAVIGGIVVLFPALVNIVFGLKTASQQTLDVISVYGGGTWTAVRKVALPAAIPSVFAAIRISVPGAITGALLAEWLSTGTGIGGTINKLIQQVKFSDVWAAVVIVTFVALIIYSLAQMLESLVLSRMGMLK